MNIKQLIAAYNEAVFDTDRDKALQIIHDAVANGVSPEEMWGKRPSVSNRNHAGPRMQMAALHSKVVADLIKKARK
jgi:hypothetical protein